MKHDQREKPLQQLSLAGVGAMLVLLSGCASEGPLRPPSLMLPGTVRALSADRSGGAVDLTWTNPKETTDGVSLAGRRGAGTLLAEVCRAESFTTPDCTPFTRLPVTAGTPASFHDILPADLQTGPARPLHYRVRVLNGSGKGAAFARVLSVAGEAPAPVQGLQAMPVAEGIQVRWSPAPVQQDRTLLRVVRGARTVGATKPQASTLLAVEPARQDPGGAIDSGGHAGEQQVYTVYRTHTVHIEGSDLVLRGESATVTVAAEAKAPPPAAPTGLEAISNTLGAPEIDLVWQASPEPGVAGYLVFRSVAGADAVPLTAAVVHGFSYADTTAKPGVSYRYSVSAVAADGRAGKPSTEVAASIQSQ